MRKRNLIIPLQILSLAVSLQLLAQSGTDTIDDSFVFTAKISLPATPVRDQAASGTCWSFAATSFLESEIIRLTADTIDISEMYFVRKAYEEKARRYVRLHGSSNFGEGGQAHDIFNVIREDGMLLQSDYSGLSNGQEKPGHSEMTSVMKSVLDAIIKNPAGKLSPEWMKIVQSILDIYLGKLPETSPINKRNLAAKDIPDEFRIDPDKYIEITSFAHAPFYTAFQLEVPDNWAMERYYNLPLDQLVKVMKYSLEKGYTVCWDGDVSNKGFSHKKNLAIVPNHKLTGMEPSERAKWEKVPEEERGKQFYGFTKPVPEREITQENRQLAFDDYSSTDDHLMHITGLVTDQHGNEYFLTKNSWSGESNSLGGYLYMSEAYVRLFTIAILVNIESVPKEILKKLHIEQ